MNAGNAVQSPWGIATKARLVGEIVRTYGQARRALRRHDLRDTLATLRQRSSHPRRGLNVSVEDGTRLGRAVTRTLRVLPADSRCLMQSLVLTSILARRGVESTLVIGVQPGEKFGAHAWVEIDEQPVLPAGSTFPRLVVV